MLNRIDDLYFRIERMLVVVMFLVMSVVVFADVLHRMFADQAWQTPKRLVIVGTIGFLIVLGGVRTSRKEAGFWPRDFAVAVATFVGIAAALYALVWLVPSGLVWAQTLALVLMIWVAFLGASIAAKDNKHLKVDAAEKIFKGVPRRWVAGFGNVLAAFATFALAILSVKFCLYHYGIYAETDGAGGSFEALEVPKFAAYAIMPVAFTTMALRFVGHAVRAARGQFSTHDLVAGAPVTEEAQAAAVSEPTTREQP